MNYCSLNLAKVTRSTSVLLACNFLCIATSASAFVPSRLPPFDCSHLPPLPRPPSRYFSQVNTRKQITATMATNQPSSTPNGEKADNSFANFSSSGSIPTFDGDEKARATDFANYFCAYSQLYHQKQMLTDHNRMAAYHAAIVVSC